MPWPWRVLTPQQLAYVLVTTIVSAITFTFTAIGMTFLVGSITQSRVKGFYNKMTTALSVMNATTESTYIAEILVPLVAFGLPLSPIGLTVGLPLFNAPPVYTTEPMHNLHNLLSPSRITIYGFIAVVVASAITYPIVMRYARCASAWVMRNIAQEAVLSLFAGLVVVLTYYEGGGAGVAVPPGTAGAGATSSAAGMVGVAIREPASRPTQRPSAATAAKKTASARITKIVLRRIACPYRNRRNRSAISLPVAVWAKVAT